MYSFVWDKDTGGYLLTNQTGKYVANEIRPVFATELSLTGLGKRFFYDKNEIHPLLWAQKNVYLIADVNDKGEAVGRKVAQLNGTQYGKSLSPEFFFKGKMKLEPINIVAMVAKNSQTMSVIIADAKRRTKELYDASIDECDIAYIAFSGGKDSIALLDICHRVLPLSVPVIFSDTDMELPDTYRVWEDVKVAYADREFISAKAESSALENWRRFAPPSRTIRWCCSVHKSTPALMCLKKKLCKSAIRAMAFVGVRWDESHSRSFYEDAIDGVKNASQLNRMPILDWGAHELWLYIFANDLIINCAYRKGIARVGCVLCPESSGKHIWFIDKAYPRELKPYNNIIIETSNKTFKTSAEKTEYIGELHWQARKSGAVLKDTLALPLEEHDGLCVKFQSPHLAKDSFFEWIKTLGSVIKDRDTAHRHLKLPNTLNDGIPFCFNAPYTGGGIVTFEFSSVNEKLELQAQIKAFLKKVSSCIACRSCEAECPTGAITTEEGKIYIDESKCTHCHKCYEIDNSCWRFMSMRTPEKSQSATVGINNYKKFGLREFANDTWISVLADMGDSFFPWHPAHPLGKKMVESARSWFIQAGLIYEDSKKPTYFVEIFRKFGGNSPIGWEIIWMSLANNAYLIKWFVADTQLDITYNIEQLAGMLSVNNPSLGKSTIDGGLAALKDMLTKSPLGGDGAVTLPVKKGRQVQDITRKSKPVHPLTILYGLYLIAKKAGYSGFTIRDLLVADVDAKFVSPLVAFAISPDDFKRQCEGLRSKYPSYIETTFTHGNDGLTVFPEKHTLEDIVKLVLGD